MSTTLWERYFKEDYDAAELDYHSRLARPAWITYIEPHFVAGYAMRWPLRCPHCNRSLLLEQVDPNDIESAVVLLVAEERLQAAPCPYCKQDIAAQRATKETIEQWEEWQFLKIWVAVNKGEQLQVQEWNA
jgi:phage terminase large subunit GpA-like protein